VLQKIGAGLRDVAAGRVIPYEQVMQELRNKWLTGGASAK
jgi:predicted transcriptional regulator